MFFIHEVLAKLGVQTEKYKTEQYIAAHPSYVVMSTKVGNLYGKDYGLMDCSWKNYLISKITGDDIFFARKRQKVYFSAGKAEMNIFLDIYNVYYTGSNLRSIKTVHDVTFPFRVVFNAENGGSYRICFDSEKHELQIVYERGDEHKIYTFS